MKKSAVSKAFFVFFISGLISLPAAAEDELFGWPTDRYGPKPASLTFTLGTGVYLFGAGQHLPTAGAKATEIWNYSIRLGWAISNEFELEGNLGFTPTQQRFGTLNVYDYALNGIGQYSVTDRFVPYLTLGVGAVTFDGESVSRFTRFALNYGGGVKFFVWKNLALRPDVRALTSFDSIHTALLGTLNLTYYTGHAPSGPGDRDGDGIPDDRDRCPDQPETKNGFQDEDGCPDEIPLPPPPEPTPTATPTPTPSPEPTPVPPGPPPEVKEFTGVIKGIYFMTGKSDIRKDSYLVLDRAVAVLQQYPKLRVRIEGHTDSTGGQRLNMILSRHRAESVKQYLVDHGVPSHRLDSVGRGPDKPIAPNDVEENRARNRRIEFTLVNPEIFDSLEAAKAPDRTDIEMVNVLGDEISFKRGTVGIPSSAHEPLNRVSDIMSFHPKFKLRVEVFTKDKKTKKANLLLSQQRANALKSYLVRRGIGKTRIIAKGVGSGQANRVVFGVVPPPPAED